MSKRSHRRSDQLLEFLSGFKRISILTHNNPDPDAVASAWAMAELIDRRLGIEREIIAGGAIFRAENRRMMELLEPPITFRTSWSPPADACVVLVDCSPVARNHLLSDSPKTACAVIDHHQTDTEPADVAFSDIRPNLASSSTILVKYMRQQGVEPCSRLATAMVYGIRTDAYGWTHFTRSDQQAVSWLNQWADQNILSSIESAPLPRGYFTDLLLALETTEVYDDMAVCFLPQASGPEIVGEVADLLIRCDSVRRVLCAAVIAEQVMLSARTTTKGGNANSLVRQTLDGLGHGGGHHRRAGGVASLEDSDSSSTADLLNRIKQKWMGACNLRLQAGVRLVAPRDILENL